MAALDLETPYCSSSDYFDIFSYCGKNKFRSILNLKNDITKKGEEGKRKPDIPLCAFFAFVVKFLMLPMKLYPK